MADKLIAFGGSQEAKDRVMAQLVEDKLRGDPGSTFANIPS